MGEVMGALSVGDEVANSYQILGVAGAGGMGVVYRAHDMKLERTVALKFLPAELNSDERRKRMFLREARTASSLDHPNVGVIHGIEETGEGRTFIVMAYYEGESLAERIRSGPIPAREALDIALQMAQGLAAAHARQIAHRDIKPSNVMLTSSGSIKIVDFGLAHSLGPETATELGITGTVAYMAPEQANGRVMDQRSDIWSVGVVMAEMLTGRNPFDRGTISATIIAILSEPPLPMDEVPVELQQIVYRALSKDPAGRYQQCSELIADLEAARSTELSPVSEPNAGSKETAATKRLKQTAEIRKSIENAARSSWPGAAQPKRNWKPWLGGTLAVLLGLCALLFLPAVRPRLGGLLFPSNEKHIAVLPFDIVGGTAENDALVQGLMDSLTGTLSNLEVDKKALWVVPASEVRRLKVTDPAAALKQLGANLVVKGSIRRDGTDIHLDVNLIDTKSLRQIGSAALEDRAGDLATLQNEAVSRLARLMNITVTADMLRNTGGSVNPAAYEDYLTALGYMQRYDKAGNLDLAITALENSIRTDPSFALGYAQLGEAYRLKNRVDHDPRWVEEALANCKRAVDLDDRIPAAYVTLGRIHDTAGKRDLALQEFQHALTLDPKNTLALAGLARVYENSGRLADAETTYQKAAALRPDYWDGYDNLGNFYKRHNRLPEAIAQYRHALELTPDNAQLYSNLAAAYLDSGDPKSLAEGEQALKRSIEISPGYPAYANLGLLYFEEKRYADSAAATEQALKIDGRDYMVWNNLMLAYQALKDASKAEAARRKTEQLAEQVVAAKPQEAYAHSMLAMLYAMDKLTEKSQAHIQTALALAPDDPNVLSNVGEAYELMGNRRQALEYIHKSLQKGTPLDQITNDPSLQALVADPKFRSGSKSSK
ncbi:MAG: serine/threonine protein kinase with repeat [Edaphobacter sp.]|nr:serine/threonine protein kinase with repeat [Edaphobacter sp.]